MSTREKIFGINQKSLGSDEGRAAIISAILENNEFLKSEEV